MLFYVRRGAWLKSERNHGAIAAALHFYVGKSSAAHRLCARHISGGNFHIEAIATPVSFIIIQ